MSCCAKIQISIDETVTDRINVLLFGNILPDRFDENLIPHSIIFPRLKASDLPDYFRVDT